jgi:hypothetical protein
MDCAVTCCCRHVSDPAGRGRLHAVCGVAGLQWGRQSRRQRRGRGFSRTARSFHHTDWLFYPMVLFSMHGLGAKERREAVMRALITGVLVAVYLGMAVRRIPGLTVYRTGIALTGVIVILVVRALEIADIRAALDLCTLLLLLP